MLVLSVAPHPAWPNSPSLEGVWSGFPCLPKPKVLCCHSCFRFTQFLHFPVFLSLRTKEQGEVVGQAATLSHEVRRDAECHRARRCVGGKSSKGARGGAFPSGCPCTSCCFSPSWLLHLLPWLCCLLPDTARVCCFCRVNIMICAENKNCM